MRIIKGIRENRRKGLGMSLGLRVQRLQVQGSEGLKTSKIMQHHETDEVSRTRRFEGFEDSLKALETLRWFHEGFPLTITSSLEKH